MTYQYITNTSPDGTIRILVEQINRLISRLNEYTKINDDNMDGLTDVSNISENGVFCDTQDNYGVDGLDLMCDDDGEIMEFEP